MIGPASRYCGARTKVATSLPMRPRPRKAGTQIKAEILQRFRYMRRPTSGLSCSPDMIGTQSAITGFVMGPCRVSTIRPATRKTPRGPAPSRAAMSTSPMRPMLVARACDSQISKVDARSAGPCRNWGRPWSPARLRQKEHKRRRHRRQALGDKGPALFRAEDYREPHPAARSACRPCSEGRAF